MSITVRPDLAALEYSMGGLIADKIFKTVVVPQEGGTYEFAEFGTVGAASRTIGDPVVATTADFGSVAYSTVQTLSHPHIARERTGQDEKPVVVSGMRKVALVTEGTAATILNALVATDVHDAVGEGIETARLALLGCAGAGKIALVCSASNFGKIMADDFVAANIEKVNGSFAGLSPRQAREAALGMALGVDEVLVGNDTSWTGDKVWLCVLPSDGSDPVSEVTAAAELTKGQGEALFVVEAVEDSVVRGIRYDIYKQSVQKILNPELIKTLNIVHQGA